MNTTVLKGLIMAVIALVASTISTSGFPATAIGWEILGITVVGTILVYLGKNAIAPSTSAIGTINVGDLISGAVVAIGSALSSWAAAAITATTLDWKALLIAAGTAGGTYLLSKFGFGNSATTTTTVAAT
jgi:hypothetical protein